MILLYGESCNFSTTLPNMADGGKVYAFRSYPGRLSASTAVARRSGTGDTNRGNLANKSILGKVPPAAYGVEDLWKEKPLCWMFWPSLGSLSATMFSQPGMCRALESLVSWYTRSRFSIVGHKVGPTSCLLPCLCMTLLWCCRLLQVLSCSGKGLGTLLKPERLLLLLDSLYAACFQEGTRFLLQCARLSERPTLFFFFFFDASVNICRACYIGCNGWPVSALSSFSHHCKWGCRDLGIGITFSSDSGTFQ